MPIKKKSSNEGQSGCLAFGTDGGLAVNNDGLQSSGQMNMCPQQKGGRKMPSFPSRWLGQDSWIVLSTEMGWVMPSHWASPKQYSNRIRTKLIFGNDSSTHFPLSFILSYQHCLLAYKNFCSEVTIHTEHKTFLQAYK